MILVITEIWQAVDMLATRIIPLLREYDPEIPTNYFWPLLLPKLPEMQRLHVVESYIAERRRISTKMAPSIFAAPGSRSRLKHFTVRYYESSAEHQALRARIEATATERQQEKMREWEVGSTKYQQLMTQATHLVCTQYRDQYGDEHHPQCTKCQLNSKAKALSIVKYEWPLPKNEALCASAVVELDCPESFVAWRNITWMMLHDLGRALATDNPSAADTVLTFEGLVEYRKTCQSRITLGSTVKSFVKTHYIQRFPLNFAQCFSNNALQYQPFDTHQQCWLEEQIESPTLDKWCTMQLPKGPYERLQYAVDSNAHAQNEVIADQDLCSPAMSLHQFISFGSLRADGERTQ